MIASGFQNRRLAGSISWIWMFTLAAAAYKLFRRANRAVAAGSTRRIVYARLAMQ
jgi:hypothetical protein